MVRSLANVIFKKIWLRLVVLRQRLLKTEENAMKQKEDLQDRKMSELAMSAADQMNQNQTTQKGATLQIQTHYERATSKGASNKRSLCR